MIFSWSNWAGSVHCTPQTVVTPASEAEICALVRQTARRGGGVRVVGSGHSFTPLCATDDLLLSLDHLQGVVSVDSVAPIATVWAGTKLYALGDLLWEHGLAQANLGDIDRQALAGAISTGTHGTGRSLGSLSTQVVGLRLVLASGEVLESSPTQEAEIFHAGQVALGALGIITQVTLKLLPAYHLHERSWVAPFEECVATLETHIQANRHFEFFWVPEHDACAMKALNPVPPDQMDLPMPAGHRDEVTGRLARYVRAERIDRSYRIFPSERTLRFNEIEFALPASQGPECLAEIRQLMRTRYPEIVWPLEYRTLAADDIPLSPAYGRESVTISVHQAAELPYQHFFADVEAIFRNHSGRPHWGKIHSHSARELRALYPLWDQFQTVRHHLDPHGLFLNDYLRLILEI